MKLLLNHSGIVKFGQVWTRFNESSEAYLKLGNLRSIFRGKFLLTVEDTKDLLLSSTWQNYQELYRYFEVDHEVPRSNCRPFGILF